MYQFSSDQFSLSVLSGSLWPHESQHSRPPCPSPTPGVHSNSRPSSQWCHPAILSSVVPFSSSPQSHPASESFPMSQLFAQGGQSIGVSAPASVLPVNTQDWYPLERTGWISLQSKGLSRVFSNTTGQNHQFFDTQLSSQSNSHIHTWLLEKPQPWLDRDGYKIKLSSPDSHQNNKSQKIKKKKKKKKELNVEELMLLNCGVGEDSWESLGLQGDPTSPS